MTRDDDSHRTLVDKRYGVLDDVLHFNRHGSGPFIVRMHVNANVHPSPNYPEARIAFGFHGETGKEADFGGVLLTIDQAGAVVRLFQRAIRDAVKACPSLVAIAYEDLDG